VDFPPGIDADTKQTVIQAIVNQCAAILPTCGQKQGCSNPPCDPPPPTTTLYYNRDATCNINCQDGSPFSYTVVAGTFAALDQATADRLAQAYACEQVALRRICLSAFDRCLCVGQPFSIQIGVTGGLPPFLFSLHSGSIPDGLNLTTSGLLSGTPTTSGDFTFHLRAISAGGGSVIKGYDISVLEILTTSAPAYSVGVPYSLQLLGGGGSGNYQWSIASGTLPDGLTMTNAGLISGTPTSVSGTNPVVFRLVDLSCQAAVQSTFPPRATLSTQSTTRIATILGYPEYIPSTPPKKYKTITWAGTSDQVSQPLLGGPVSSNAHVEYSGVGQIDVHGNVVSKYQKNLSVPCAASDLNPTLLQFAFFGMQRLIGYCWPPDPHSCPTCQAVPEFKADISTNMIFDEPVGLMGVGQGFSQITDTTLVNTTNIPGFPFGLTEGSPDGVTNFPKFFFGNEFVPAVTVSAIHNYSATLSDEYTDAEALANALVIVSNGTTAENRPRTTGFVSRFTNVVYTVRMTNLVIGQNYLVTVTFRSNPFFLFTKQVGVMATATTMQLTDVVPTPSVGVTTTVTGVTIAFIP